MLRWIRNALAGKGPGRGPDGTRERLAGRLQEADGARHAGELPRAEEMYRELLDADPDLAGALAGLGEIAALSGNNEEAAGLYRRAISIDDSNARYHFGLGCALHASGDWLGAGEAYRGALKLDAAHAAAHMNLGCILQERAETEAALIGPQGAARQLEEALEHFRSVRDLAPGNAEAWMNLGYAMARQRKLEEALRCYDRAIELQPRLAEAHFNRSMALLAQGKFSDGWSEYEWRWQASGFPRPVHAQPEWDGAPLGGRTLLLYSEQGFGDAIQFVRYAPLAAARGARVIVRSTPELHRLFASVPGVSASLESGEALPPFDAHCPLLSLPRVLGTTAESIPAEVPYISAEPALAAAWRREIGNAHELRVGLVWASQPMARIAPLKSIGFADLAPLLRLRGVKYYSLQKGEALAPEPAAGVVDLGGRLEDFADTAALIASLDLTISVDTAVAHLAGAMGKPVWTLLPYVPDWRWHPDGLHSRWYPSMRLYRQAERGDWKALMAGVAEDLEQLCARRSGISPT